MKVFSKLFALVGFILNSSIAMAADPLVDVEWVKSNLDNEQVTFVDLRPKPAYLAAHVPNAVHSQYGGPKGQWRVKVGDVKGMVRDPVLIAQHLGEIGISNNSHIVLIPVGSSSSDIGAATRVYWTLNYIGHDEVSILNGGMSQYLKEVDDKGNPTNPLESGSREVTQTTYEENPRSDMLISPEDVEAMAANGVTLVDARTNDFHLGINKSVAVKTAGTLPGAVNLPHTWTTGNGKGIFRDAAAMVRLHEAAGVPTNKPQISFCNTGHLASVGWFVSHELLGNDDAVLFDGSMAEWTHSGRATEQKVHF